jgi:pyruvate dehydrogenase E1 component alpha subunit
MGLGGSMHLADFSVGSLGEAAIVGSTLPIATGAGLAIQMSGEDRAVLSFFGDGATGAGVFHESLNMAAIWKLPVVFLCENNMYAVSVPFSKTSAVPNVADRASAYDIPGVIVDGQDVLAVYDAVQVARKRAVNGDGPTLIEAKTYRYTEHSLRLGRLGGLRAEEEIDAWTARDPIAMFSAYLAEHSGLEPSAVERLETEISEDLERALELARSSPPPTWEDLYSVMYADPTGFQDFAPEVVA